MLSHYVKLVRTENLACGIGQYAVDFLAGRLRTPDAAVRERVELFHADSKPCAVAALATETNEV